uniref:Uncharacterized protein n=1 Tax=Siphoviridae sp. ctnN38 TaxID=2826455 RepID=A0A8S5N5S5_9CAUD|nr:MAG TPA: hypothetical protein [Siphoviridae sp. ctnN38]
MIHLGIGQMILLLIDFSFEKKYVRKRLMTFKLLLK